MGPQGLSSPSKDNRDNRDKSKERLEDLAGTVRVLQSQLVEYEHKQQALLEENMLLRSLQENCEQKELDIVEENCLLREKIEELVSRLRKVEVVVDSKTTSDNTGTSTSVGGGACSYESVGDIDLVADLDKRLPILQRMYQEEQ